jgi:hypothetical protein
MLNDLASPLTLSVWNATVQETAVQCGGDVVTIVTFLVMLSQAQRSPASEHAYIQIRRTSVSSCSWRALTQGA